MLMEKPRHIRFDESGVEVVVGKCRCIKCDKIKDRKMMGHQIGNIFFEEWNWCIHTLESIIMVAVIGLYQYCQMDFGIQLQNVKLN